VLWSTCLPIRAESLAVGKRGEVTIAGATRNGNVRPTFGAYASPGGDGIAVIRLDPAGNGPEWIATVMGNQSYPNVSAKASTAVAPDGSVYGLATVTTESLPVTETALALQKGFVYFSPYFFRLSADGSKLLYATYVNDGNDCYASDVAIDGEGNVFASGSCESFWLDSRPSMATPGTFATARSRDVPSAWVARFDPAASGFRYICVFEQLADRKIALASAGGGRVVVAGLGTPGLLTPTEGAYFPKQNAVTGGESFVLTLNSEGTKADVVANYGLASVRALELDANGNMIVAGEALRFNFERLVVATTANAWRIVGGADEDTGFILKLSADGSRVIYSTGVKCRNCEMQGVSLAGDTLWIAGTDGSKNLAVAAAQLTATEGEETSMLRAVPDNWSETVPPFQAPILSWDTRDPAVRTAEIRLGTPEGPVVGRGSTGALTLNGQTATYYFVDASTRAPRVLGVETFTRYTPLSGIPASYGYSLTLNPNPVLSCREAPLTGTETKVNGSLYLNDSELSEVRVGAPDGPVFARGFRQVFATTGDWVRNGVSFFLAGGNQVYGSVRAYVLPNRACTSDAALEPMIRATRDCVQKDRFTLAWYAGAAPVEIREGSPSGHKVGRFTSDAGLFDVSATSAKTYWLMSWQDGGWKPIASTIADPRVTCEQGVLP
jgi:hypothetical protein